MFNGSIALTPPYQQYPAQGAASRNSQRYVARIYFCLESSFWNKGRGRIESRRYLYEESQIWRTGWNQPQCCHRPVKPLNSPHQDQGGFLNHTVEWSVYNGIATKLSFLSLPYGREHKVTLLVHYGIGGANLEHHIHNSLTAGWLVLTITFDIYIAVDCHGTLAPRATITVHVRKIGIKSCIYRILPILIVTITTPYNGTCPFDGENHTHVFLFLFLFIFLFLFLFLLLLLLPSYSTSEHVSPLLLPRHTNHLPPPYQLLLGQTCRTLRRTLRDMTLRLPEHDKRPDFVRQLLPRHPWRQDYLFLLTQDQMDTMFCETDMVRRPIDYADTPQRLVTHGWPETDPTSPCSVLLNIDLGVSSTPAFKKTHAQTALKYVSKWDAIDTAQRDYAEQLLAEIHTSGRGDQLAIHCAVYPKVVVDNWRAGSSLGPRYHFMVKTVYTYSMGTEPVAAETVASPAEHAHPSYWRLGRTYLCDECKCAMACIPCVVRRAFKAEDGAEVSGFCKDCPTDFSVQVDFDKGDPSRTTATLRIWSYLGDRNLRGIGWNEHIYSFRNLSCVMQRAPHLRLAGSVADLYEGGKDGLIRSESI
ncbi:hypothetical protein ACRALDRAFT_210441 [Sodiomyces alcalophilus JCM 7366]|uniref:uncharacterized protein n=1 Tax=Sodiomyces alcalophilus JCM 7366 TaxID=591952 RepID=UPI0039B5B695